MKLGLHPDNQKGELALEQLHFIKDVMAPDVQRDIDRNHVVELSEVEIVPCNERLLQGSFYGIRRKGDGKAVPISPALAVCAGRYRAWVLPTSGVAVALEPLDDEATYLSAHRRDLFELQHVEASELIPLSDLRLGKEIELPRDIVSPFVGLVQWIRDRRVRPYFEKTFTGTWNVDPSFFWVGRTAVFRRLVVGVTYRIRPTTTRRSILEPVVPIENSASVGPYR